jgi:hypothetical protein
LSTQIAADAVDDVAHLLVQSGRFVPGLAVDEPFVGTTRTARNAPASPHDDRVAPWWPFAPGPLPRFDNHVPVQSVVTAQDEPDAVLGALEPLDERVGDIPIVDLVREAYRTFEIRE